MEEDGLLLFSLLRLSALGLAVYYCVNGLSGVWRWMLATWRIITAMNKLPSPPKHWLYGHLKQMPPPGEKNRQWKFQMADRYPRLMVIWFSSLRPMLFTWHPETCRKIMMSTLPKQVNSDGFYSCLAPWLGDGLLTSSGPKWFRNRRLLTPAFHFDVLKPYIDIYNRSADSFLSKLSVVSDSGKSLEIFHPVSLCTLNVILKCAFSYDADVQNQSDDNSYVSNVIKLASLSLKRARTPWIFSYILHNLSTSGKEYKQCLSTVHAMSSEVISKRKSFLKENQQFKGSRHPDFLDILLLARDESGEGLTDSEIRDEVDTFLFEGHDTTASAISWTLHTLSDHPDHQEKCYQEICEMLSGRENHDIMWEDLGNLPYLTRCIKESMRLHSPVPNVAREVDTEFDIEGVTLPVGSRLCVNIVGLHHNKTVWGEDTEVFRPERFEDTASEQRDSFAFLPFAAGARNCIGQNFAMNEIKVVLARTLYSFRLSVDPAYPADHRSQLVTRAMGGLHIFINNRH